MSDTFIDIYGNEVKRSAVKVEAEDLGISLTVLEMIEQHEKRCRRIERMTTPYDCHLLREDAEAQLDIVELLFDTFDDSDLFVALDLARYEFWLAWKIGRQKDASGEWDWWWRGLRSWRHKPRPPGPRANDRDHPMTEAEIKAATRHHPSAIARRRELADETPSF